MLVVRMIFGGKGLLLKTPGTFFMPIKRKTETNRKKKKEIKYDQ